MISAPDYPRRYSIAAAAQPLGWIFWGVLICLIDLTFSQSSGGYGFRFDIVNDLLGTVLIAFGVARLSHFEAGPNYATVMAYVVRLASYLAIAEAALRHFVVPPGHGLPAILGLANLFIVGATVLFCFAMRWLSEAHGLGQSAGSWRITSRLMIWLYLVPYGLLQMIGWVVALRGGGSIRVQSLPLALLAIVVMAIPGIHLLVSLWRMRNEVEGRFLPPKNW